MQLKVNQLHSRRSFLTHLSLLPTAFIVDNSSQNTLKPTLSKGAFKIRLGGPVFKKIEDPEELALEHKRLGYAAAYCPELSLKDKEKIRAIETSFKKHRLVIAEVGRWVNLLESDSNKRKAALEYVIEGLALADEVGALCCVNIVGSYNSDIWYGPHPKNLSQECFDAAVENARIIIDTVKPKRAKFCYETMGWTIPDSPETYLALLGAVDRSAFGVHLDPCNLINSPRNFYHNDHLIKQCFSLLGPWIVSLHAKDIDWKVEMNIHFIEVQPCNGKLRYDVLLRELSRLPHQPPLMLEHLNNAEEYQQAAQAIRNVGKAVEVEFE